MLIDSHCHLDNPAFDADREQVLERAKAQGVSLFITIGASDGLASAERALALAEKHSEIFAAVGVHPCDAGTIAPSEENIAKLLTLAQHPKTVAIGETGLDYYWEKTFAEQQKSWLKAQIQLAQQVNKPLVIHSRSAGQDCLTILQENNAASVGGVFHCYAENLEFAKKLAKMNFLVSFPGVATFKNARNIHEVVRGIPLEQMLVETDAPYLSPEPFRGKRCEPAYVRTTAAHIAKERGLSLEALASICSENTRRLFKLHQ